LFLFLIVYCLLAGVSLLYGLLSLWHVFNFPHVDSITYFVSGLFIAGIILIVFVSLMLILQIDWSLTFELFSSYQQPGLGISL